MKKIFFGQYSKISLSSTKFIHFDHSRVTKKNRHKIFLILESQTFTSRTGLYYAIYCTVLYVLSSAVLFRTFVLFCLYCTEKCTVIFGGLNKKLYKYSYSVSVAISCREWVLFFAQSNYSSNSKATCCIL